MTNEQIKEKILSFDPKSDIVEGNQYLTVNIASNKLVSLGQKLKDDEDLKFDYLTCLSGVDYGDSLGVVYHLGSSKYDHMIVLKTKTINRDKPVIDSVTAVWQTANFQEREVYDLLGITFRNHPYLRRMFLDASWGFPLRKDYVDDVKVISK